MSMPTFWIAIELAGEERRAVVLDSNGAPALNRAVPSDPEQRAELFRSLLVSGPALVLFEEPAALDGGVSEAAAAAGADTAFLPGAAARREADIEPGRPRDIGRLGTLLAEAARLDPAGLLALKPNDARTAGELVEEDTTLHGIGLRYLGQLRQFLDQRYPEVAAVLGPHLDHPAVLTLLERHSTPDDMRTAGRRRLRALLRPIGPTAAEALLELLLEALGRPESANDFANVERVIPSRAGLLRLNLESRAEVAEHYALLLPRHELAEIASGSG
jgi:hypothetical protein